MIMQKVITPTSIVFRKSLGSSGFAFWMNCLKSCMEGVLQWKVMWSELTWFMWGDFVLEWSEVSYGEVLGDKSTMYIRVTLYWGYLIVLWLFHSGISCVVFVLICTVVVLYCFVMCVYVCMCVGGFCNVWVWVCVGFVMCGCVYVWVL